MPGQRIQEEVDMDADMQQGSLSNATFKIHYLSIINDTSQSFSGGVNQDLNKALGA